MMQAILESGGGKKRLRAANRNSKQTRDHCDDFSILLCNNEDGNVFLQLVETLYAYEIS